MQHPRPGTQHLIRHTLPCTHVLNTRWHYQCSVAHRNLCTHTTCRAHLRRALRTPIKQSGSSRWCWVRRHASSRVTAIPVRSLALLQEVRRPPRSLRHSWRRQAPGTHQCTQHHHHLEVQQRGHSMQHTNMLTNMLFRLDPTTRLTFRWNGVSSTHPRLAWVEVHTHARPSYVPVLTVSTSIMNSVFFDFRLEWDFSSSLNCSLTSRAPCLSVSPVGQQQRVAMVTEGQYLLSCVVLPNSLAYSST